MVDRKRKFDAVWCETDVLAIVELQTGIERRAVMGG